MPAIQNVQVVQVSDYKKQPRRVRSPKHSFNLKHRPFEITPMMFAPVLPGETLDSAFLQSSVVSDKIANPLIGWWQEYHFFYVPLRALTFSNYFELGEDDLNSLFLDPAFNLATTGAGAYSFTANSVPFYGFKGGNKLSLMVYKYLVRQYFRDEDEDWDEAKWDDYAIGMVDQGNLFNSLKEESVGTDDTELPGVDELEELDIIPGFTTHYAQWELMRDHGMTDLSYRDYLKSYGITAPDNLGTLDTAANVEAVNLEEKIISIRKWTNPTLAPQQGDSASTSVVYWRCAERITKRLLFKEPGFIVGLTITRPKIYLGNQKGAGIGLLNTAYSWLPAVLNHLGYSSLLENLDSATDGILQGGDEDYWLDMKDLFLHGDQFVNHTMGATANHGLALPVATDLEKKYITEAMMNSLFADTGGTASYIKQDGMVHLDILGRLRETTPTQR